MSRKEWRTLGRSTRQRSNPTLAKAHEKGAQVTVVQLLAHVPHGAIGYLWPRHWTFHIQCAERSAARIQEIHRQVLLIEPGDNAIRLIADEALIEDAYIVGGALVSNAVRAVQHLAEEIERNSSTGLHGTTVQERIRSAVALFSQSDCSADPDYAGLNEIVEIRDAIEHPTPNNTYSGEQNAWAGVPLAWTFSDRSLDAWNRFRRWFDRVAADWETHLKSTAAPQTLTVERGVESQLQFKKPPTNS
jgi:hypothetical protein